jgi:membrane protease YdiL (CAAX protease family)
VTQKACSNCGHPLSESARFCPHCGQDVTTETGTVMLATEVAPPASDEPEDERPRWRALEGLAVFLIAVIATGIFAGVLVVFLRPLTDCGSLPALQGASCLDHRDLLFALTTGFNEVALLVTVLLWVRLVHRQRPRALGFKSFTPANVGIGVAIGIAGLFVAGIISLVQASIIQGFTHKTVEAPKQISLQHNPQVLTLVILAVSVVLITPFAEEAFFRGFIFRRLAQRHRVGIAIVISAAIFGLAHLIPLIMLPIFGLGVLLASIVRARKSIVPSIFAHMTFNGIQIAILLARKQY